jgi:hypothetical protein
LAPHTVHGEQDRCRVPPGAPASRRGHSGGSGRQRRGRQVPVSQQAGAGLLGGARLVTRGTAKAGLKGVRRNCERPRLVRWRKWTPSVSRCLDARGGCPFSPPRTPSRGSRTACA